MIFEEKNENEMEIEKPLTNTKEKIFFEFKSLDNEIFECLCKLDQGMVYSSMYKIIKHL